MWFPRNWNHIQPINVIGLLIFCEVAGDEDPKLAPISADEFAGDVGIVETLRLKMLGVKQRPGPPRRRCRVQLPAAYLPTPFGLIQVRVVPLRHDVEIQTAKVMKSRHADNSRRAKDVESIFVATPPNGVAGFVEAAYKLPVLGFQPTREATRNMTQSHPVAVVLSAVIGDRVNVASVAVDRFSSSAQVVVQTSP